MSSKTLKILLCRFAGFHQYCALSLALLYDLTLVRHIALGFALIRYPVVVEMKVSCCNCKPCADNRSNTVVFVDGAIEVVHKKRSEDCEAIFNKHPRCQLLHRLIGHGLFNKNVN